MEELLNILSGYMPVWAAVAVIALITIWTLIWKGVALWKSAQLSHKWWFVALLIINTVGLLEIFYIFFIAKKEEQKPQEPQEPQEPAIQ